jgi:hypothetical protein
MSNTHTFVKFEKSKKAGKKYTAILKNKKTGRNKKVHFGASKYQQYKDSTGLGKWSHKNHNDAKRRKNFKSRMGKFTKKKFSPAYFSNKYLW